MSLKAALARFLQTGLSHRPNLATALGNMSWLFFDKVVRMGVSLLVGVWVARYLGPAQFGLLNYATAIVALFAAIAPLGLNNIVMRDLVNRPENTEETLGTACFLHVLGGSVAWLLAIAAIALLRPNDRISFFAVAILGFSVICKCTDVVSYWFAAHLRSKYVVWTENTIVILSASIKAALIFAHCSLLAFVWVNFVEAFLIALALLLVYASRNGRLRLWKLRSKRAVEMLRDSWPLIISGVTVMIYMRIDQVMLGQMVGDGGVGVFSAALRLSEIWYFIPTTMAASMFPLILQARSSDVQLYELRLRKLLNSVVALAWIVAMPISLFAKPLISIVYGEGFAGSASVLVIHIWTSIFVFAGIVSSYWFITERLQHLTLYRTLAGCVLNVGLNLILIPRLGAEGAAISSVAAQAVASVFYNALDRRTRPMFYLQLEAILLFGFLKKYPHAVLR